MRHLAVALLWIQERLRAGDFTLWKIAGVSNPADIFTKALAQADMAKHLKELGLDFESGRASSAPANTAKMQHYLA